MTNTRWENVYKITAASDLSWFQESADLSLDLIGRTGLSKSSRVIDIGGGASTLVDDLQARGHRCSGTRQMNCTTNSARLSFSCVPIARVMKRPLAPLRALSIAALIREPHPLVMAA